MHCLRIRPEDHDRRRAGKHRRTTGVDAAPLGRRGGRQTRAALPSAPARPPDPGLRPVGPVALAGRGGRGGHHRRRHGPRNRLHRPRPPWPRAGAGHHRPLAGAAPQVAGGPPNGQGPTGQAPPARSDPRRAAQATEKQTPRPANRPGGPARRSGGAEKTGRLSRRREGPTRRGSGPAGQGACQTAAGGTEGNGGTAPDQEGPGRSSGPVARFERPARRPAKARRRRQRRIDTPGQDPPADPDREAQAGERPDGHEGPPGGLGIAAFDPHGHPPAERPGITPPGDAQPRARHDYTILSSWCGAVAVRLVGPFPSGPGGLGRPAVGRQKGGHAGPLCPVAPGCPRPRYRPAHRAARSAADPARIARPERPPRGAGVRHHGPGGPAGQADRGRPGR